MPTFEYAPRDPSASAVYAVVREHVESFLAEATRWRDGQGLPGFVEDEFRAFLQCGFLAGGFARFRCGDCTTERLVAFSCKGRGFCPSCGGRRMAERAAHLVDHVLPDVPIRQWVLTLPHRLRYLLAWRHDLCRRVARILHGAIGRHLRAWAQAHGIDGARGGGVSVLQRFGGAVNLNVHVHALVFDGVWARTAGGRLRFHAAPVPSPTDVAEVLATIVPRIRALVARHGLDADDARDPGDASPVLAGWAATSVEGLVWAGAARRRPARLGTPGDVATLSTPASAHAQWDGYDLHGGVRVPAGQRDRLERVCRYALRPPLAEERITTTPGGDGASRVRRGWRWADLMRRVFAVDVLACARCGGRLRLIATLEASETTRRILRHLDLPTDVPAPTPARAPPGVDAWAL